MMIIGLGNDFRHDDAAGLIVARKLRERGVPAEEHAGDLAALLELWEGAEGVILVDAVSSGAVPGTLRRLDASVTPLARELFASSSHALSLADLPTPERRIEAVMELTDGFGADVVADFVGYPDVVPEGLRMVRSGGCYLEVGSIAPGNLFSYDVTALMRGNVRLVGTSNYSPWALAEALAFLRRAHRRLPFAKLVSHVFPLGRIGDAFREADWMQRGNDGLRLSRAALSMEG